MESGDIAEAFGTPGARWEDGTPIRIILRPESESDVKLLQEFFPGMTVALENARTRPEVPVAATDLDNTLAAESTEGSLAAMTLMQLRTEKRALRPIAIDGTEPTLENFEAGRYPYGKTIRFAVSSKPSPALEGFAAFLSSEAAAAMMRDAGLFRPRSQ
jgi:phosphate transport system substrate-binding protein